jgi:hypothetical protein
MATAVILNLLNSPTAATHYSGFSYKVSWKESKIILNHPFFVSMATAAKFVQLMATIAMETAKMLKNWKTQKWS